jgi:Flp pilus assembly protein TadG
MHGQKNPREKGQSLVEFALALPILILIVSGLLDIGRAYFAYIYVEEAAAEAATYLALHPNCVEHGQLAGACNDPNNALWRARNSGSTMGILRSDEITITVIDPETIAFANTVAVDASVPFQFVTPGIAPMAEAVTGSSIIIFTVRATNRVLSD